MTPEQLLRPRFKAIADYPRSQCNVGDILEHFVGDGFILNGVGLTSESDLKKYPHLFRRLEWWEERKPEDMPEYVKRKYITYSTTVFKIERWDETMQIGFCSEHCINILVEDTIPATQTEYDNYINSNK